MTTQTEDTNMADETITPTPDTAKSLRSLSDIYMQMSRDAYGPALWKALSDGALVMSLAAAVIEGREVELDRLRTELASARANEARYLFLRDANTSSARAGALVELWLFHRPAATERSIDAAIDAALSQVQP